MEGQVKQGTFLSRVAPRILSGQGNPLALPASLIISDNLSCTNMIFWQEVVYDVKPMCLDGIMEQLPV